jgi:hypothetical protein
VDRVTVTVSVPGGSRLAVSERGRAAGLPSRQRVPLGLGDDAVPDPFVQRTGDHRLQQGSCLVVGQPADRELVEAGQWMCVYRLPDGEDQRDRVRHQPARHERQRLQRGVVEPLGIVDDAHQRLGRRCLGEQGQHGEPDVEPIRDTTRAKAERRSDRLELRRREPVEMLEVGPAQLMQPGEGELHLRLDAGRPRDPAFLGAAHQNRRGRPMTVRAFRGGPPDL